MKRIIIVDDNNQILDLVKEFLEEKSFKVHTFDDAQKALEAVPLFKPHLVISDIKMVPLNGIEFFHRVKDLEINPLFIFMTGFADLLDIKEAIKLGAYSLIKKPFEFNDLLKIILKALRLDEECLEKNFDEDYFKIDLKHFVSGKTLICDIFVKLRKNHYIKCLSGNNSS